MLRTGVTRQKWRKHIGMEAGLKWEVTYGWPIEKALEQHNECRCKNGKGRFTSGWFGLQGTRGKGKNVKQWGGGTGLRIKLREIDVRLDKGKWSSRTCQEADGVTIITTLVQYRTIFTAGR